MGVIIMNYYYENTDDLFLEGEIFKNIEGYNGDYQVSNLGRIKSFKGEGVRILKQKINKGHLCIRLYKSGEGKDNQIHDIMFETFNNYKLKSSEIIHHKDKNPLNNLLDNFQLMTNSEHMSYHTSGENNPMYGKTGEKNPMYGKKRPEEFKQLMKEKMSGENSPTSILTEQDVIKIRELIDEGDLTLREIARIFGVHESTISAIKNRRSWSE